MPSELVIKAWNTVGSVDECAKIFQVSPVAMSKRLERLDLINNQSEMSVSGKDYYDLLEKAEKRNSIIHGRKISEFVFPEKKIRIEDVINERERLKKRFKAKHPFKENYCGFSVRISIFRDSGCLFTFLLSGN